MLKSLAQNSSAFWDHERGQFLQRTKAPQRLQSCNRLHRWRLGAFAGNRTAVPCFRCSELGDPLARRSWSYSVSEGRHMLMKIVAILATYNEERFVRNCIRNLVSQGASIYLIDNDSTD